MKTLSYKIATFVFIGSFVTCVFAVDKKLTPQNTMMKKTDMSVQKNASKISAQEPKMHVDGLAAEVSPDITDVLEKTDLKVAFVDSYQVMGLCQEGEKARTEVEAKQKEYTVAIQQEERDIQQAVEEYKSKASMLSEAAREKEEKQLIKKERELKASVQDKEEELKLDMQIRTEKLARNMDAGVKKMAKEQNLDVVFDRATGRAIYVADAYDMTEKAIEAVNKEYTIKLAQEKKAEQKTATVLAQK